MNSRLAFRVLSLLALTSLAGCNTVSGLGEDLKSASSATAKIFSGSSDQPKTASTNDGTKVED